MDYVQKNGQGNIAGINFVAAGVVLGPKAFGPLVGPGFLENGAGACQDDLSTNIAAIRRFLRACFVKRVSQEDFEEILAFNRPPLIISRSLRCTHTTAIEG